MRAAAPLLTLCVLGLGCTYPTDADQQGPAPLDELRLVRSTPPAGAVAVSPSTVVDLTFNLPPDAETVVYANVRLFTGLIETYGDLRTSLLKRRIRFTPHEPLRPDLRYHLYISSRLRALDGATLPERVTLQFTTGEADRTPLPPAAPPATATQVQEIWGGACASCHRPPQPPANLDLSSAAAAVRDLRAVPSSYAGKLRVVPGDHARSYLMLKLLDQGQMVGFPMPPDGPRLRQTELQTVASWIDGGAAP